VDGRLGPPEGPDVGLIDVPMKKWQDFSRREFGSVICANEGLPAVTKYKALRQWWVPAKGKTSFWGKGRWFTLVQMRILTGRTHQIRVHMAFIGHPLVGDTKYNPAQVEQDSAIVPRIFLHCLRMEFEDMDGSTFVAASDLAADLQVSLGRLEALARPTARAEGRPLPRRSITGFAGLGGLLACSKGAVPEDFMAPDPESKVLSSWPRIIIHHCKNCKIDEEARCTLVQRNRKVALCWKVLKCEGSAAAERSSYGQQEVSDRQLAKWGPGLLWVPTELQQQPDASGDAGSITSPNAGPGDLGEGWAAHGSEWAWAHDGTRQNGWMRLQVGGLLSSKWGAGHWRLLSIQQPPLLLVTFSGVEHALRLTNIGFDMVSKRRLASEGSLADSVHSGACCPDPPACCPTRGWPCPCPSSGR